MKRFFDGIREWSLDDKVAQVIMVDFNEDNLDLVLSKNWAGVIVFSKNVSDPKSLYELNQTIYKNTKFLPFIGIDQEGGTVFRFDFERYPAPPSNMAIAQITDLYASKIIASINARILKSLGFNLNFAPVLDVNYNPYNPIINVRSYGDTPLKVALYGTYAINGYKEEDVISVGKHFPGHGSTFKDSHLELPVVEKSLEKLEAEDILPFKEAINKVGLDAIMTAHILYPLLDHKPATLSKKILGYLREELKFDKVVFSDALNMLALKEYSFDTVLIESFNAGCDVLLVLSDDDQVKLEALDIMVNAVRKGFISQQRLDQAISRIINLKKKYLLKWPDIDFEDKETLQESIELMRVLIDKTIEVKRFEGVSVPRRYDYVVVMASKALLDMGVHVTVVEALREKLALESSVVEENDVEALRKLSDTLAGHDVVLVSFRRVRPDEGVKEALNLLLERLKGYSLLNLANPYLIDDLERKPGLMVNSFGYNRLSQEAAVKAFLKELEAITV